MSIGAPSDPCPRETAPEPGDLHSQLSTFLSDLEAFRKAGTPAGRRFEQEKDALAQDGLPHPWEAATIRTALTASPQGRLLLERLGTLAMDTGYMTCARLCFETAAAGQGASTSTLLKLGLLLERQNRHGDALDVFKRALAADPDNMEALLGACRALSALGNHQGVRTLAQVAIGIGIAHPELFALLARSLLALGARNEAALTLEKAAALFPDDVGIIETRLDCLEAGSQAWTDAVIGMLQKKSGLDALPAINRLTRRLVEQDASPAVPADLPTSMPGWLPIRFNHAAPADGQDWRMADGGPEAMDWSRSWLGPPSLHPLPLPRNLDGDSGRAFGAHAFKHSPNYPADVQAAIERFAQRGIAILSDKTFPDWYGSAGRRIYEIAGAHLADLSVLDRNWAFLANLSYPDQLLGSGNVMVQRLGPTDCRAMLPLTDPPIHHRGEAQLLSASFHQNVYHWLMDDVPRLLSYGTGPFGQRHRPLLLNDRLAQVPFVRETIEALGISDQIALYPHNRLVVTDHLQAAPGFEKGYSPEDVAALRHALLRAFKAPERAQGDRILYVSRFDATSRREDNVEELRSYIDSIGGECVSSSELSMEQRAHLFSRARLLIGANGAGMTNMLFCPPGTPVIEVAPTFPHPCYWILASALGLPYHVLISGFPGENLNFQVDIGALRLLVKNLI